MVSLQPADNIRGGDGAVLLVGVGVERGAATEGAKYLSNIYSMI